MGMSFQMYSGGVMTGSCGTQLDHGCCGWVRHRWRQGLLEGEKFVGCKLGRERIHPNDQRPKSVRYWQSAIIPSCEWLCCSRCVSDHYFLLGAFTQCECPVFRFSSLCSASIAD